MFLITASLSIQSFSQEEPANPEEVEEPLIESLKKRKVPEPKDLHLFIQDKGKAIELGKALFWDMQVGSDGYTSCATCHFHAGADSRSKNQLSPGLAGGDEDFFAQGPNYMVAKSDFPLDRGSDEGPDKGNNDVVSSQGVFLEYFDGLDLQNREIRNPQPDNIFNVNGVNTRRVEPRNTPTVINAVFNLRNFWDGRAQDRFNGVNPHGRRDKNAYVWKAYSADNLEKVSIDLNNASLASQAVGPPLSHFEMSAKGRTFPEIGRKLLHCRPLAKQQVHKEDSVLGAYSRLPYNGITYPTYSDLIKMAFLPEWWQGEGTNCDVITGEPRADALLFTQMEANFSLYFGLAIQLYEATLVSDRTPFDKYVEGKTNALTDQQVEGMNLFFGDAKCGNCHGGAEFTKATVKHAKKERLERMIMGDGQEAVYDNGFYNIGVRPTEEDLGVGGRDPFGLPLSEARLAQEKGSNKFRRIIGSRPNIDVDPQERIAADGAFKTSGLRNIALTAPYFHNGSARTLREVVRFYNRGGNFPETNIDNLDPDITRLNLDKSEIDALVAFLAALTDPRVKKRKAPFDHPQLFIPNGHHGDHLNVSDDGSGKATESFKELPATGKKGGIPFKNFLQ